MNLDIVLFWHIFFCTLYTREVFDFGQHNFACKNPSSNHSQCSKVLKMFVILLAKDWKWQVNVCLCVYLFMFVNWFTLKKNKSSKMLRNNAHSHLVYNYSNIMFTHNASVLLISLNMGTGDLSVNKWETKVSGITFLKK